MAARTAGIGRNEEITSLSPCLLLRLRQVSGLCPFGLKSALEMLRVAVPMIPPLPSMHPTGLGLELWPKLISMPTTPVANILPAHTVFSVSVGLDLCFTGSAVKSCSQCYTTFHWSEQCKIVKRI